MKALPLRLDFDRKQEMGLGGPSVRPCCSERSSAALTALQLGAGCLVLGGLGPVLSVCGVVAVCVQTMGLLEK